MECINKSINVCEMISIKSRWQYWSYQVLILIIKREENNLFNSKKKNACLLFCILKYLFNEIDRNSIFIKVHKILMYQIKIDIF